MAYGVLKHHYGVCHLEKVFFLQLPAVITYLRQLELHPATQQDQLNYRTTYNTKRVKASRTCTIHCHPRGTGNGNCYNKSSGVDANGGEGATLTAGYQAEDSQDDSEVE